MSTTAPSAEVIRVVFTVEDIEHEIRAIDENRGADGKAPLDHEAAFNAVLEWAKHIEESATARIYEQMSDAIEYGQP